MTRDEFEALAEVAVSDEKFELINFVYTFHPAIDEVVGKSQVVNLYKNFGMRIISDMLPTASQAKNLEDGIRAKAAELEKLRQDLADLRKG